MKNPSLWKVLPAVGLALIVTFSFSAYAQTKSTMASTYLFRVGNQRAAAETEK